ncbi:MAG: ABC transporter ATP-binding protein [Candidatus Zixiibacteriota bacterium]|nr:MAG: ABC transporter ATP-binding protein [candidate division Zixibacteria bacterium]
MSTAQIKISGLSKSFDGRDVFADITEVVSQGECLVIGGPNGSGKTTLLRIMAGLLRAGAGSVEYFLGNSVIQGQGLRRKLSLVSQDLALYDELTALENLHFLSRIQDCHFSEEELVEKLSKFGLTDRGNDLVGSFSSGMKQRLKYLYALLKEPKFLLLDEPTANLDEEGVRLVDEIIKSQKRDGIVVLATNESSELNYGEKTLQLGL